MTHIDDFPKGYNEGKLEGLKVAHLQLRELFWSGDRDLCCAKTIRDYGIWLENKIKELEK
jgi:hypothetical protein